MSKKCIKCGTILEDDALFCSECGEKQNPIEKKCQHCGAPIMNGAKFCMNCGTPVVIAVTTYPAQQPQPQKESAEYEVTEPDENTLSFNIMGVPFDMKFIKGGMLGEYTELSDFYIGETVVSQALWQTVMGDNPSKDNSNLNFPVTNVNIQLCKSFLVRLKKITGVSFTLPTWSQFRYAAFKGSENMDDSAFDETRWGNKSLHPVCGMVSNALGLYDLSDWTQLVADEGVDTFGQYCFNPRYGRNIFSLRLKGPNKTVYASGPERLSFCTVRLVLNIPVDSKVEHYKKKLEEKGGLSKTMAPMAVSDIPLGHPLESIIKKKQQQYTQAQNKLIDEENKRLEEEARRKEEEKRLKREKEEKRKAEALAKREEAKRKKEEAERLKREEEERCKAEEQVRKEEEERKRQEAKRLEDEAKRKVAKQAHAKASNTAPEKISPEPTPAATVSVPVSEASKPASMEYVDLGLSVKWAKWNLGATAPEEFGDYFAWGETIKHDFTDERDYKFRGLSKYNTKDTYGKTIDNLKQLEPSDDAAHQILGGGWRMPTIKELNELMLNCKVSKTTINGIPGKKYTSKVKGYTDKWIFLPGAGEWNGNTHFGKDTCRYWTSTLYTRRPDCAMMMMDEVGEDKTYRTHALSIRPVTK